MPVPKKKSPRPISDSDYQRLASFRYALRRFLHSSEELARDIGLSPQQHHALLAIRGYPGPGAPSVGDLATRLQIRHNSAVGLVNRLVSQGLVRREAAPEDRRQVRLALTRTGAARLDRLTRAYREELKKLSPHMRWLLEHLQGGR